MGGRRLSEVERLVERADVHLHLWEETSEFALHSIISAIVSNRSIARPAMSSFDSAKGPSMKTLAHEDASSVSRRWSPSIYRIPVAM
jgi:hypothetical protein